ncbi:PREDICTED: neuropeptide Y receptor type 2 [Bactrocera latifrons]|uniref:neuropeptide Y receptor type 2 n=1 Tax=Bactrocera latifrons TaxID=174628 RepID=UPI0008DD8CAE|nr:PREDICTED: neuropeptide Y receptor type 2 [Bactrocera latifrons]
MACLFENRKFIENAVRHVKSTLNVSEAQGFANDDEVVVADGFRNNSAENEAKIFVLGSYIGIFKEDLITVTATERITLTTVMSLLLIISVCGNICSLRANMRRQLRPFFRACLISLAISDLINTTFLTMAYLSQILQEYSQVWLLGSGMCRVVPSITTAAILVSSITLVGIAMDRYFAVMCAVISFWNPGVIFCVLSMLALWAAAIGTSWPVSRVYELHAVHILTRHWIPVPNTYNTTIASAGSATVTTATTAAESYTSMPTLYETSAETVIKSAWEQHTGNNNQSYAMLMTSELVMMCISNQTF